MKKLFALLLLVAIMVFSLTSCADASDIGAKADNAASLLEFNYYETLKVTTTKQIPNTYKDVKDDIRGNIEDLTVIETKDKDGNVTASLTIYNCKSAADAEAAYQLMLPLAPEGQICEIYNDTSIIIGKSRELISVTMPDGVKEMVVANKKVEGKSDEKISIYYCDKASVADDLYASLSATVEEGLEVGISSTRVYIGSKQALVDATQKNWFNQLNHTFIEDGNYNYILEGLGHTLLITLAALVIGVVLGMLIAVAKYFSEGNPKLAFVNAICDLYTTVIRGIPMTVLLLIFFFVILVSVDGVAVAIIAFGINSGAYMAELIRSGINAVDKGQMEAARSLGLSKGQAMVKIIFPQAIKNILPAIGNECIALLKETSVAGYVAVVDLTRGANLIRNNTYDAFNPLILSALIYLILVVGMTKLLGVLERRLRKSDGK